MGGFKRSYLLWARFTADYKEITKCKLTVILVSTMNQMTNSNVSMIFKMKENLKKKNALDRIFENLSHSLRVSFYNWHNFMIAKNLSDRLPLERKQMLIMMLN